MALKADRSDLTLSAAPSGVAVPFALISDRDAMSSQLLADTLVRNRQYQAAAIAPAQLLCSLKDGAVGLVVIGAELAPRPGCGFDLAQAVARAYPRTAIVMLLDAPDRASVIGAFRAGARAVFSRQQPLAEFLDCIDSVRKGFIWAGQTESTFLLDAFRSIPAPVISVSSASLPLTVRELQVVREAAQGKTNRAIANDLGLSEHTVKNYLFRAFDKLGVSSRVELLFCLTIQGHRFGESAAGKTVESVATPARSQAG